MVYLEGRYSPHRDQGLKWEEDLGQTTPCPPGTSHVWAWAGAGNRGSLDTLSSFSMVPSPQQGSLASLSWSSGPLAPKSQQPN